MSVPSFDLWLNIRGLTFRNYEITHLRRFKQGKFVTIFRDFPPAVYCLVICWPLICCKTDEYQLKNSSDAADNFVQTSFNFTVIYAQFGGKWNVALVTQRPQICCTYLHTFAAILWWFICREDQSRLVIFRPSEITTFCPQFWCCWHYSAYWSLGCGCTFILWGTLHVAKRTTKTATTTQNSVRTAQFYTQSVWSFNKRHLDP